MTAGRLGRGRQLAALATLLAIAGCVPSQPLILSNAFVPPSHGEAAFPKSTGAACTVRFADVKDVRPDRRSMGGMDFRQVYHDDSEAWVRSGLNWLTHDARLKIVDSSEPHDLVISTEIVKAYIAMRTGTEMSVSIVLRAKYSRGGASLGEEVVRGHVDKMNWAYGDGEIQSSFDSALRDALLALDQSIVTHCKT